MDAIIVQDLAVAKLAQRCGS
ncbi:MAG: hypothetical protein ACLUPK_02455 [Veillonella sp.]